MRVTTECLECGANFTAKGYGKDFCGASCRQKFNNRRATRGAALYDLVMAQLETPVMYDKYELAGRSARMIEDWQKEDRKAERTRTTKRIFDIHVATLPYQFTRR